MTGHPVDHLFSHFYLFPEEFLPGMGFLDGLMGKWMDGIGCVIDGPPPSLDLFLPSDAAQHTDKTEQSINGNGQWGKRVAGSANWETD
jgi:hypothetical protein